MRKKKIMLAGSILLASSLLGLKYLHNQAYVAKEKNIVIRSPKIKNKIRITHITDFHSNVLSNLDQVITEIRDFNPDFIVLTGDMIDYSTDRKIERTMFFINHLSNLGIKIYFVSGNHEDAFALSTNFYNKLEKVGIKYLRNEGENLEIRSNNIYLYGRKYFDGSIDEFSPNENSYNIILSHFSKHVRNNYKENIDLILSGHTHGGQVRLPLLGGLLAPGEGYLPNYDKGLYLYKDSLIYIDSGLGNTFLPLRFLNPIGFTNITITNEGP